MQLSLTNEPNNFLTNHWLAHAYTCMIPISSAIAELTM